MEPLAPTIEAHAAQFDACDGLDDLARFVLDAKAAARALAILIGDAEQELAARMDDNLVELPGLPPFEKKKKAKSVRWDSDALFREIRRMDDPLDVLAEVAPLTASLGWRRSALKKHGIDPDDFCSRDWTDRYSIRFHGGDA